MPRPAQVLTVKTFGHDLLTLPADQPAAEPAPTETGPVSPWEQTDIEEILEAVKAFAGVNYSRQVRGARLVLQHLTTLPGDAWADRWLLVDAQSTHGGAWHHLIKPGCGNRDRTAQALTAGLGVLMVLDVVRPSYEWQTSRICGIYHLLCEHRDPDGTGQYREKVAELPIRPADAKAMEVQLGKVQACTGKSIREISAEDLLEMQARCTGPDRNTLLRRHLELNWRLLIELGWISHEQIARPRDYQRKGRMTPTELVDYYGITGPQREVFIEYLKQRAACMDYSRLRNVANRLLGNFWADIAKHHPGLPSFALAREMADGWKERIRTKPNGQPRAGHFHELYLVRSFYLDMAQWALEDSYWARWAVASPVARSEVTGYKKVRRKQIARTQHRTRQIAPTLPHLVRQAAKDRRETRQRLADAQAAGPDSTVEVDGQDWIVRQAGPHSPIRIEHAEVSRNLAYEEDAAFWTWALVETLRHTGVRCEELLELTHLAIVPYTVPATGEEIPLLHIVPSKTDQERLLVASPELVAALSEVIHRIRKGQQQIPLTQRWDGYEREFSAPLPHLFCRLQGSELRPMSSGTVQQLLSTAARRAGLSVNGQPVKFTTHDFRRVFATEALASGLPPHIVQAILGHKSIATTQGYAAVYPADIIRHHRTHIAQRRQLRPSEEYRQPTAAEWEEFEAHFVKRKLSLGSCGRAYGTNCHHEHACLRCALLRVDPDQADRLREIITNLRDRIAEAEHNSWLGEVEGLKVSLAGAEDKLDQMDRGAQQRNEPPVLLELRPPSPPNKADSTS